MLQSPNNIDLNNETAPTGTNFVQLYLWNILHVWFDKYLQVW